MSSNRSFGILFFFYSFFDSWLMAFKNGGDPRQLFLIISVIFLILGLLNSKILTPLNKIWVKFGELLGKIIAPFVMGLFIS